MAPVNMGNSVINKLATFAFVTRILLIFFQFIANILIPDHDAKVFNPPIDGQDFSSVDHYVEFFLGGFRRWDAVYFTHISEHGYTFENCAAFFPLFPLLVSFLASGLSLTGVLHFHSSILLVAVLINCVLFVCTAVSLYMLGLKIGLSAKISFLSSVVFCVNPSSIFMSAPYSEILYMFMLLLALLFLQDNKIYQASFFIGLSIFTRSNGLVGLGFIIHNIVLSSIISVIPFLNSRKIKFHLVSISVNVIHCISGICISLCICTFPFFLYQYYIFVRFCLSDSDKFVIPDHIFSYGRNMKYKVLGDTPSSWCSNRLPLSYSYIQSHYWGVGFLKYYEMKQIPNFLLAVPVVICSVQCCWYFFNLDRQHFYGLGLLNLSKWMPEHNSKNATASCNATSTTTTDKAESVTPRFVSKIVVFTFHLAFLVMFGCLFVHIQVLTRMLFSSSPLLYWYCGFVFGGDKCFSHFAEIQLGKFEGLHDVDTLNTDMSKTDEMEIQDHHPKPQRTYLIPQKLIKARRELHPKTDCVSTKYSQSIGLHLLTCVYRNWTTLSLGSKAVITYCGAYFVIGTVMFSNFLPWT